MLEIEGKELLPGLYWEIKGREPEIDSERVKNRGK